ncbi:hypothetical protein GCM10022217_03280 [Chryseobacterium ginsenosidimutans]|uniref:RDD family protein n=1 Tax=Chryseobacterium ginsenosidimutans TaxID=687846 RepID=UPI0031D4FEF5
MRNYLKIVDKHRASTGSRFANSFLDGIFLQITFYIFVFIFGLAYAIIVGEPLDANTIEDDTKVNFSFMLVYFLFYFGYFILMEYYLGKTLGKYITGTSVISIDGNKPTIGQIIGRTFSRLVPFDAFSFLGENGWHDSWSDTRVINTKNYQSEKQTKSEIDTLGNKEFA